MSSDQDQVAYFVECLRDYGIVVVGYSASTRDGHEAAARKAEEIIGRHIEIVDSGIQDDGYGSMHIKIAGMDPSSKIPDHFVRAYDEAHRPDQH